MAGKNNSLLGTSLEWDLTRRPFMKQPRRGRGDAWRSLAEYDTQGRVLFYFLVCVAVSFEQFRLWLWRCKNASMVRACSRSRSLLLG
ncbi:hypothetical protein CDAR_402951 [Caerostris darwini]|uniref:Uncharacterized protein n=1 Tax=Caerostris darwini TaxID=1538125 RepID=A0AAV4X1H5_9ARAC|nr:hypothetical protein CDAR_402951 [Caerostris darwini]